MLLPILRKTYRLIRRIPVYLSAAFLIKQSIKNDRRLVNIARNKNQPLNILFFVIHESVWKLDSIYKKMMVDKRFNPIIIICPYVMQGDEVLNRDMNKAYDFFKDNDYIVSKGIDDKGNLIDIKNAFSPDIIFFTNPHDLTHKNFLAVNYLDVLSIYIPYTHQISKYGNYQPQYNQLFHNLMWKIFTTNDLDKKIFEEFSYRKGNNVIVSGYPGIEYLLEPHTAVANVWKKQTKIKKKIIYAPHHTISETSELGYSTFLQYSHEMIRFAKEYADDIQISFKPHPLLRDKLAHDDVWGEKATDEYFEFWTSTENTQLDLGEYLDLFLQSDAIIHDSGSFLAEYLYVDKPSMYLFSRASTESLYNPFGLMCLNVYDKGYSSEEIENFIVETVIKGIDSKKVLRQSVIDKYLTQNKTSPSDLIIQHLESELIGNDH
jgi:hypothetical protein